MNGVDSLLNGQRDHVVDVEVGLDGIHAGADQISFIRLVPMEGESIFFRIESDRPDAQFMCRSKNANRDFTSIGGQQAFDS